MIRQISVKIDSEPNKNGVRWCTISKMLKDDRKNSTIQTLRVTIDEFIQLKSDFEMKVS